VDRQPSNPQDPVGRENARAAAFGKLVLVVAAALELRHLATDVLRNLDFESPSKAALSVLKLDDVRLVGLVICIGLIVSLSHQLVGPVLSATMRAVHRSRLTLHRMLAQVERKPIAKSEERTALESVTVSEVCVQSGAQESLPATDCKLATEEQGNRTPQQWTA